MENDSVMESLVIQVEYRDDSNSKKNINLLTSALKKLNEVSTNLDGVKKVTSALRRLSKVSFENLNQGLKDFNANFKDVIQNSNKKIKKKTPQDIQKSFVSNPNINTVNDVFSDFLSKQRLSLETISKLKDDILSNKSLSGTREYDNPLKTLTDSVIDVELLNSEITALINKKDALFKNPSFVTNDAMRDLINNSILIDDHFASIIKKLQDSRTELNRVGKAGKKTETKLQKLGKSLMRITFYRAVRGMFVLIIKAIKEGVNNFVHFSDTANTAMSRLKAVVTQLTNNIGATLMSILVPLTPVLELIGDGLSYILNAVQMLFKLLAGDKTIIKATKNIKDYRKELKQAQNTTLGIDELNTLGNTSPDYSEMFIESTIQAKDLQSSLLVLVSTIIGIGIALAVVYKQTSLIFTIINSGLLLFGVLETIIGIKEVLDNGMNLDNMIILLSGVFAISTALVGFLKGTPAGLIIGFLVAGIGTFATGLIDAYQNGLQLRNIIPILVGIGLIIGGLALLVGGLPALVIGGVMLIGSAIFLFWDNISAWCKQAIIDIKDFFQNVANWFDNLCKTIGNFFINIINKIVSTFEVFVNFFIDGINAVINALNKISFDIPNWIPSIGGKHFGINIRTIPSVSYNRIPMLANGGFVNSGQLFIARESGAELVGAIGNRTTVANNDQIVEGIYQGVLQAITDANTQNNTNVKVYLDSKEIASKVEQRQNEKGASIYKGGVLVGNY